LIQSALPQNLLGLTYNERVELKELPWVTGKLGDFDPDTNTAFLVSGRTQTEMGRFISPGLQMLGLKPFFKQIKREYQSALPHSLMHVNTDELAKFFFKHPKAMQSFINMERNQGYKVLPEWESLPKVWLVASDIPCWESVHLALAISERQGKKTGKKTLYLEWQNEGVAAYTLLGIDVPPALVQSENQSEGINELVKSRVQTVSPHVDAINLHFLSIWSVNEDQWASVFWELREKYDEIIVHLGTARPGFLFEQSDAIFILTSSSGRDFPGLRPEENTIAWPNCIEINRASKSKEKSKLHYPFSWTIEQVSKEGLPTPDEIDESDDFWLWFEQSITPHIIERPTYFLSDSHLNYAGAAAVISYAASKAGDLKKAFSDYQFVCEGGSGLIAGIGAVSGTHENFIKNTRKALKNNLVSKLKPVYPSTGIFSLKPVQKYLEDYFGSETVERTFTKLSTYCVPLAQIEYITSGLMVDALLRSLFPLGFLDRDLTGTGDEPLHQQVASHSGQWYAQLAKLFRSSAQQTTFFRLQPAEAENRLVFNLFRSTIQAKTPTTISGRVSEYVVVPVSELSDFEEAQVEITTSIHNILG